MKDLVPNMYSRAPAAPEGEVLQVSDYSAYGGRSDVRAGGFAPGAVPEGITLRDAFSGKEDQGPVFGLRWLDFGARTYSPALRRWMVPDPLGEKYPAVSPYAYCAGDPVNYVDPTGESHYKVDDEGNIVLVESTEDDFDVLYINFSEIGPNQSYKVNDTSLLKSLASDDSQQKSKDNKQAPRVSSATSANLKEVAGLFKFLADNTSVEWVIHDVGSDYTLGTIHENGSAGSWMDYGIVKKPERSLHSQVGIYRPLFIRTWK